MGLLCFPLVAILYAYIVMRKEDTKIKSHELAPIEYLSNPNLLQHGTAHPGQYGGNFVPLMGQRKH